MRLLPVITAFLVIVSGLRAADTVYDGSTGVFWDVAAYLAHSNVNYELAFDKGFVVVSRNPDTDVDSITYWDSASVSNVPQLTEFGTNTPGSISNQLDIFFTVSGSSGNSYQDSKPNTLKEIETRFYTWLHTNNVPGAGTNKFLLSTTQDEWYSEGNTSLWVWVNNADFSTNAGEAATISFYMSQIQSYGYDPKDAIQHE